MRDGQIEVGFVHKGLDEFMHKLDVAFNRLIIAFVVAAGLIGSSMIGVFADFRPAGARAERRLGLRLLHLRRPRALAAVGRLPLREDLMTKALAALLLIAVAGAGRGPTAHEQAERRDDINSARRSSCSESSTS